MIKRLLFSAMLLSVTAFSWADKEDTSDDPLMKAGPIDTDKVSGTEKTLYEQSIRSTKDTIARDTLDVFYHDALDYYHENRYDDALEQLDKIYSIDPTYADVARLRDVIRKRQQDQQMATTQVTVQDYMHQAAKAMSAGQRVVAIADWKQALAIDPKYTPARKKIQQVNHDLAQAQFEAGYLHYHNNELEDALDSWSNAIALDPSYKERGLMLLMSKVDLSVSKEQISKLEAQAFDQYQQKDYEGSLASYGEILKLEPRHDEARRMSAKIKNQLGHAAFRAAQSDMARHHYSDAIKEWQSAIGYEYEIQHSQDGLASAQAALKRAGQPVRVAKHPPTTATPTAATPATTPTPATASAPPASTPPANPEEAMQHYRTGLSAIRAKDYHVALEELNIAYQLDPTNERIYVARTRAQQEWSSASGDSGAPQP